MSLRRFGAVAVAVVALAACGSSGGSASTTTSTTTELPTTAPATTAPAAPGVGPTMVTSAPVPIGQEAPTTTIARTTTTGGSTTAPSDDTTTTTAAGAGPRPTVAPGAPLALRANGVGPVLFGSDPDAVIASLTNELGAPTRDSGWMDPLSLGTCPGTEVRTVVWGDLSLFFGDESNVLVGRPHLFAYSYGPVAGSTATPANLEIDGGGTLGSTVSALRTAHPTVQLFPADPTAPASFAIADGLTGQLSGTTDTDTVTRVQGGIGCGE